MKFWKSRTQSQILFGIMAFLLTAGIFTWLYLSEFSVSLKDDVRLGKAVNDYFFTADVPAEILSQTPLKDHVFLLFRAGDGIGTATLEKGFLGNYRFLEAKYTINPLYSCNYADYKNPGPEYIVITGSYTLEGVDSFAVYPMGKRYLGPNFQGKAQEGPFLKIYHTDGFVKSGVFEDIVYFDESGQEIPRKTLVDALPSQDNIVRAGTVSSAEADIVYYLFALVWLLGGFVIYRCLIMKE